VASAITFRRPSSTGFFNDQSIMGKPIAPTDDPE